MVIENDSAAEVNDEPRGEEKVENEVVAANNPAPSPSPVSSENGQTADGAVAGAVTDTAAGVTAETTESTETAEHAVTIGFDSTAEIVEIVEAPVETEIEEPEDFFDEEDFDDDFDDDFESEIEDDEFGDDDFELDDL